MPEQNLHEIKVGQYVRSYDFQTTDTCYNEGICEAYGEPAPADLGGYPCAKIKVARIVVDGKILRDSPLMGQYIFPPINGTRGLFGVMNGIMPVQKPLELMDFNEWWLSLPEGRQKVLIEDKWMLANAAFEAGKGKQ